jgi:hypothetical protein
MKRHEKAEMIINAKRDRHTWTLTDYRTVLMALKTRSDGALPSVLRELSLLYDEWQHRITGDIMMEQTQVEITMIDSQSNHDNTANLECSGSEENQECSATDDCENSDNSGASNTDSDSILRSQILL